MVERWLDSLEERARAALPEPVHRYYRQGARHGISAGEAAAAWQRFRLLPRVLRDVTEVDTGTTLLGTEVRSPIAVAPTTLQRAAHPDGEIAMARAAAEAGSLMVVSSNAGSTFEAIAQTGVSWWLQVYVPEDRLACRPMLERAVTAGARAVVLTADTPVVGTKYDGDGATVWDVADPAWLQVNFPTDYGSLPEHEKATDLGPQDVDWLRQVTGLPIVVKGVLRADDALRCVKAGASAVWVSNHGGRQLDLAAATADCVRAVAESVGHSVEVYVDGGVRSGTSALVALALGARAVFLGRPPLYALAVDGERGVSRLLEEMRSELEDAMRLAGCATTAAVTADLVAG